MAERYEYRVIVPLYGADAVLDQYDDQDPIAAAFKPDADACALIGPEANDMMGAEGLCRVTLLEWRAEKPDERESAGVIQRRVVSDWETV